MDKLQEAVLKSQCIHKNIVTVPIKWSLISVRIRLIKCRITIILLPQQEFKAALEKTRAERILEIQSKNSQSRQTTSKSQGKVNHLKIQILVNKNKKRILPNLWITWTIFQIKIKIISNKMMILISKVSMILEMKIVTSKKTNRTILGIQMQKSIWMILKMRRGKVLRWR